MKIIFIFSLILSSATARGAATAVTFENIRELLQTQNPKLEGSRLESEASQLRADGHLGRSFLPELQLYGANESFKVGRNPDKSQPTFGATLKLNLFNGGRDSLESDFRKAIAEKKSYQNQRTLSEELQKARQLYWLILYGQEQSDLLTQMSKVNSQNLQAAQKRIRSGVATESDRFEFEMKSVDLKRDLDESRLKLLNQKKEMAVLLGFKPETELQFPAQLSHDHNFENIFEHKSQDHNFLYKEAEMQATASRLSARSQRRAWWPKLDAYAAYNQYNETEKEFPAAEDRRETVLGLKLSISLASGLESQVEAQALDREARAAARMAEVQQQEVEVHLHNEIGELRFLHDQVHDTEENIERAEKYYKLTQSEYSRGVKNSPDVLGATEKLFEIRRKRLEILRDFQISKTHVLSKMGK